jgi:16S rRNA (uracil1498-N3)-methyltransferase
MRTLLIPAPLVAGEVTIAGDQARHGVHVLRLVAGDSVVVADGAGHRAEAEVLAAGRQTLALRVGAVQHVPPAPASLLQVACAWPRPDRAADLVRGLSELGVGSLLPLRCQHALPYRGGGERWQRIASESLKQCRRSSTMAILEPVTLAAALDWPGRLALLDPGGGPARPGPAQPTRLLIGPEAGFTEDERRQAAAAGAVPVRLADTILRIETAAIAAAAVWVAAWVAMEGQDLTATGSGPTRFLDAAPREPGAPGGVSNPG